MTQPNTSGLGTIGKYELVELVGEGAMGKVYRAQDPVLSRPVAIKVMSASISGDAHLRDRFLREARAAANLQHPNIITIYDFGETEGYPYIAMEFVDGTDLHHMIQEREPLSLDTKVGHVVGLLSGLAYAHAKGVVHRDIKPANIRVTSDGRVKIMDFGIAHLAGSEMTHSGVVLGTPDYMAPEQVRGLPVTAQTDIFASGAVLYELLTYEKPFGGETLHAVLFKVVTEDPVPITRMNPSLPDALERIVNTALNKDPGSRYPTADAMAADLSAVRKHLAELETSATIRFSRPLLATELLPWYRRRPGLLAGAGAGGLLAILVGVLLGSGGEAAPITATPLVVSDTGRRIAAAPAPQPDTTVTVRNVAARAPTNGASQPRPAGPAPPRIRPASTRTTTATRPVNDSAAVRDEVERLERAFATAQVSRVTAVFPTMPEPTVAVWRNFFTGKTDFEALFEVRDLDLRSDSTARVRFRMTFFWLRDGTARRAGPDDYTGILQKTARGWSWKSLEK